MSKKKDLSWSDIKPKLSNECIEAVKENEFLRPLSVQSSVIPHILSNKDVAVEAVTGSGKTLAFIIPTLEILVKKKPALKPHEIGCLILAPTYELSLQISEVLATFLPYFNKNRKHPINYQLISGVGSNSSRKSRQQDYDQFKKEGANILIATPGRLVDLIRLSFIDGKETVCKNIVINNIYVKGLRSLELLIMDEADRLLDMGFGSQLDIILGICPKQRRTSLFSATQAKELDELVRAGLRNPMRLIVKQVGSADTLRTPASLDMYYTSVPVDEKMSTLINFLRAHENQKIIVFFATCACVTYVHALLRSKNNNAKKSKSTDEQNFLPESSYKKVFALHRKLRSRRMSIFESFRKAESGILLCTDVLARGVDLPDVHWVIQFDPPSTPSSFVHRCGRTARCGASGKAVLMLSDNEMSYIDFLKINQKVEVAGIDKDKLISLEATKKPQITFTSARTKSLIQEKCLSDKLLFERSIIAYVSFVQFYNKHSCHLLFRLKDLDLGLLANCYGLLKMPKMPELKGRTVDTFVPYEKPVNIADIKYKEKSVAKQRAKEKKAEKMNAGAAKNTPWSRSNERRLRRKGKKEIKLLKASRDGKMKEVVPIIFQQAVAHTTAGKKRPAEINERDMREINADYQEMKRGRC